VDILPATPGASTGRRCQVGDVAEILRAAGRSLQADEVAQTDDPDHDAGGGGLDGSGTHLVVVAGSGDVVQVDDRASVRVEREAGTGGQRDRVGGVELEQVGIHAAEPVG
jgi:hypothetical protein